jgi:hypothetical protein
MERVLKILKELDESTNKKWYYKYEPQGHSFVCFKDGGIVGFMLLSLQEDKYKNIERHIIESKKYV